MRWWARRESNPRPPACKAGALDQLSYIGMDEATIDGLFKIDNYNSSLGTANETGTGLGLVLCNEFSKINKGSIRVESKLGEGSTFYLKLPTTLIEN